MRERDGSWGENYDVVREINDKRHSDKRWSCEERGGGANVYISHHRVNDAQRLADKTNPCWDHRQEKTHGR